MDKFFIKYAPIILFINVLGLHLMGYVINNCILRQMSLWLTVGVVDATFAFFCGKLIQRLNKQAITDALTGLKNRGYFYFCMTNEFKKLVKNEVHLSLLFIDLDCFKVINDEYGHLAGDKILVEVSDVMQRNVRVRDTVIRWGGEEFAIILPNTDQTGAIQLAERLRSIIESYIFCCAKLTVSVGVATINQMMEVDSFVKLADTALYKAKEIRNSVVFSSSI